MLAPDTTYWSGADISFLPQYDALGTQFRSDGSAVDPLRLFAEKGVKLLRLRLWVDPKDGWCNLDRTLEMAKRGRSAGMELLLNFHYSDWWADPGNQATPGRWKHLELDGLTKEVRSYTRDVVRRFIAQGTTPVMVQVGNETRPGMMWPLGDLRGNDWTGFLKLVNAGISGVREASPTGKRIPVMLHNDAGGNNTDCRWWYGKLQEAKVDYDVIGLSYYPWWHGSLDSLQTNLNDLAERFQRPVMVVETAYPFSLKHRDDEKNFVGEEKQLLPGYPATPAGQAGFLRKVHEIVRAVPGGRGLGVVYWAPEYIAVPGMKTPYENLALFDFDRNALPGMAALGALP
jgi:arabinogalactan endo-1,4-beta-galactosidase